MLTLSCPYLAIGCQKDKSLLECCKGHFKKSGKITGAVKTGWAPPIKTRSYVTDLLSGMVTMGYTSPSPPCQGLQRKLLLSLSN
jgi:hypothetical protein